MKSINDMKIINRDYDLDSGFFWVEFEGGQSLQCCLKQYGSEDEGFYYKKEIELDNNGYNEGQNWDCNEWAQDEDGYADRIEEFLIEQAREIGIQIVA